MSTEVIVAALVALSGGGGLVAGYRAWQDHRKGIHEADARQTATALDGFRSLVESLRSEVDRLKADSEEDRSRIDRIEQQIAIERDLRWSAIQYVRVLLAWVGQHLPDVAPPPVPDALAEHVTYTHRTTTEETSP